MRIEADLGACRSYAICVGIAPEAFELDEFGLLVVLQPEVPAGEEERIRDAALACPTQAILVKE